MKNQTETSVETRGRDKARKVKIISTIAIFAPIALWLIAACGLLIPICIAMFILGFIGFIVGRFME